MGNYNSHDIVHHVTQMYIYRLLKEYIFIYDAASYLACNTHAQDLESCQQHIFNVVP